MFFPPPRVVFVIRGGLLLRGGDYIMLYNKHIIVYYHNDGSRGRDRIIRRDLGREAGTGRGRDLGRRGSVVRA